MEWMRMLGMCLLAASLVVLLRQMNAQAAALLAAAFGVMTVMTTLPQLRSYAASIYSLLSGIGLQSEYYAIMAKAMGIVAVTQIAVSACMDMEAPSIARKAEILGRFALLGIAVPVFISLAEAAIGVLG